MKHSTRTLRPAFWTLTGASMVALLAGCNTLRQVKDSAMGERSDQSVVNVGQRRVPMLNQPARAPQESSAAQSMADQAFAANGPAAPMVRPQPAAQRPAEKPTADRNPYDYYDTRGSVAPQPRAENESVNPVSDFFDGMFSSRKQAAARPADRKPIPGNPGVMTAGVAADTAPLPPASVAAEAQAVPQLAEPHPQTAQMQPLLSENPALSDKELAEQAIREDMEQTAQAQAQEAQDEKPGFFARIWRGEAEKAPPAEASGLVTADKAASEEIPAQKETVLAELADQQGPLEESRVEIDHASAVSGGSSSWSWLPSWLGGPEDKPAMKEGEAYPQLSSVPQTPEEFDQIQADRAGNTEALAGEHELAMQEKEALESEPTQMSDGQMLVPHYDDEAAAARPAHELALSAPPEAAEPVAQPAAGEPELLGQASDPAVDPQMIEAVATPPAAETAIAAEPQPQAESSYSWKGWDLSPDAPASAEAAPEAVAAEVPQPDLPQPVLAQPDDSQMSQPDLAREAQPDLAQSQPAQPEVAQPEVAQSEMVQPEVAAAPVALQAAQETPPAESASAVEPLPALIQEPAAIASVDAAEQPLALNGDNDALPSPELLQEVKVLPPSRYSDRLRATQRPAN